MEAISTLPLIFIVVLLWLALTASNIEPGFH